MISPTQSDSQQEDDMVGRAASEEMYLSTVEESQCSLVLLLVLKMIWM